MAAFGPSLLELHAKVTDTGFLVFDCPNPACEHRIRIPLAPAVDRNGRSWQSVGEFPALSLYPSVDAGCWHGFIRAGVAERC